MAYRSVSNFRETATAKPTEAGETVRRTYLWEYNEKGEKVLVLDHRERSCHLFGGQVRVILIRRMYRNVSVTYELGLTPKLSNGVVVDDNLFTRTDIELPKDFPGYALRL